MELKRRVHEIVEVARPGDRASRVFDIFILSLIALSVVSIILESIPEIFNRVPLWFKYFEYGTVFAFTIEYALRIWSCTASKVYRLPIRGRIRYALTPLVIIDLIAILPLYVSVGLPVALPFGMLDLRFVRAFRLLRIFRVAKIGRYSESVQVIKRVLIGCKSNLVVALFAMFVLFIVSSITMYYVEHAAQPRAFPNILVSMWWCIITMTTVGYGDIYPITIIGKIIGGIVSVLGIASFALPTAILGSAFIQELSSKEDRKMKCPQCGHQYESANS